MKHTVKTFAKEAFRVAQQAVDKGLDVTIQILPEDNNARIEVQGIDDCSSPSAFAHEDVSVLKELSADIKAHDDEGISIYEFLDISNQIVKASVSKSLNAVIDVNIESSRTKTMVFGLAPETCSNYSR